MDEILKRDQNHVTVLAGVTDDVDKDIVMLRVDPITKALLVSGSITGQYEFISGLIEVVQDMTYLLVVNIPYRGTISQITTKSASGTCTLEGQVSGVSLGGTANSVSTTETTQTHSSSNTFTTGDDIQIRINSNADCQFLSFTIRYIRT